MGQNKLIYIFNEISTFLTNKRFIYNLLGIIFFLGFVLFAVFFWLRIYTHHGQKLELPNYVDQPIDESIKDAKKRKGNFEIIVNDSVHIVGKSGGIIQNQNPKGGSLVKEKRKIYVTITKHKADQVDLSTERFFGEQFSQVAALLKSKAVNANIMDYKYDRLTENAVLEVWYNGQQVVNRRKKPDQLIVDKGSTLDFVISSSKGGSVQVPDVTEGHTVGSAEFILTPLNLGISVVNDEGLSNDEIQEAIIVEQNPAAGSSLNTGSTVFVRIERD